MSPIFVATFFVSVVRAELTAARWSLVEDVDTEEAERRYFSGRTDGYHAAKHAHYACAVPS